LPKIRVVAETAYFFIPKNIIAANTAIVQSEDAVTVWARERLALMHNPRATDTAKASEKYTAKSSALPPSAAKSAAADNTAYKIYALKPFPAKSDVRYADIRHALTISKPKVDGRVHAIIIKTVVKTENFLFIEKPSVTVYFTAKN